MIYFCHAIADALGAKSGGESRVCNVLRSLLTPALVTPGHPTNGPFYLVKGIMFAAGSCIVQITGIAFIAYVLPAVTGKFPWAPASTARASLYISLIPLLCGYAQVRVLVWCCVPCN